MANPKIHYGKYNDTATFIACGKYSRVNFNGRIIGGKMFAYEMAVNPDNCCAQCVKLVTTKFPNAVRRAMEDPQAYYENLIQECK